MILDERALEQLVEGVVRRVVREELATLHSTAAPRGYVSIQVAADHAGVAPGTIRRWIAQSRLAARKAGRVWRVRIEDLEAMLAGNAAEGEGMIDLQKRAAELLRRNR